MWLSKTPNGPSVKFHIQNSKDNLPTDQLSLRALVDVDAKREFKREKKERSQRIESESLKPCITFFFIHVVHTMEELKMTGNCLKGSRHILSFDKNFESTPHWLLMKELFTQIFGIPKTARRIKPFVDHVISFSIVDNRIWFRNYQITEKPLEHRSATDTTDLTLVEIGPRFVMNPIRVFDGSFGGQTAFENPEFVSPNVARSNVKNAKVDRYKSRMDAIAKKDEKLKEAEMPEDPLAETNVFA